MSTPEIGSGSDFASGFLDDYFAECEEHLAAVRRALVALEPDIGVAVASSPHVEAAFRSFHSLKGLSAMVEVRDAERLAHELESCLRALRDGGAPMEREALAALLDGTALLEGVIAARRQGGPPPPVDSAVARVAALAENVRTHAGRGATRRSQADATRPSATWRFVFVPSMALVERGVKVDTIRARLAAVGRILSAAPRVSPGGGIAFEFVVDGPDDPSAFDPWRGDGLTWERVDARSADEGAALSGRAGVEEAFAPAPPERTILAPSHFVRVDLRRLDDVMRRIADLVVVRSRLAEGLARLEAFVPAQDWRTVQENSLTFERQLRSLREDVMRVRLVRIDEIFRRMPFVVRDLARETDKDVRVVLTGQDTEIDKFLVERMMDPVLHLVRNAVSHGIEARDARVRAGKRAQGVVTLSASTVGETVVVEIADDGAGIDAAAVVRRARAAGFAIPDGPVDARTLLDIICEPGLSTRREADRASGRGMGMSVVRTTVQELGGTLALDSQNGRGTRFTVALPLTLVITDALIATAGGQTFAFPQGAIEEVIEIDGASVRRIEHVELVPHRGRSLPLLRLGALFHLDGERPAKLHAFVVGTGDEAVAVAVDRILGQREVVVRGMSDALLKVDGISGATELGDGRVVLIVDAAALNRRALTPGRGRNAGSLLQPPPPPARTADGANP